LGVTAIAVPWQVVALIMAAGAIEIRMSTPERPNGAVIELRTFPAVGVCSVALLAVCRETRIPVIRIIGAIVIVQVTGHAFGRQTFVLTINVTARAVNDSVLPFKRKAGMVNLRILP
jgi:hypothetical protein